MDADAKDRIRIALRARVVDELTSLRGAVTDQQSAAQVDQESSYDADDLSQSDEGGDLAGLYDDAVARQEAALARVDRLDFGPSEAVAPGAVVGFDGDHYVVGVVADAFECDGVTYEGISEDSPLYAAIAGLREGDTFAFAGGEHRIDQLA